MLNTDQTDDLHTYNNAPELTEAQYALLQARVTALAGQYVSPNDKPRGRRSAR